MKHWATSSLVLGLSVAAGVLMSVATVWNLERGSYAFAALDAGLAWLNFSNAVRGYRLAELGRHIRDFYGD